MLAKQWSDANAAAYRNTNTLLDKVAQTQGLKDEFLKSYTSLKKSLTGTWGRQKKTLQTLISLDKPKNAFVRKAAQKAKELTGGAVDLISKNKKLKANNQADKFATVELPRQLEKEQEDMERNYWSEMAKAQREHDNFANEAARSIEKNDNEALRLADRLESSQPDKINPKLQSLYESAGVGDKVKALNEYNTLLGNQFDTPEKLAQTLVNKSKKVVNPNFDARLKKIDEIAGTNLMSDAELIRAHAYFSDPSLTQLSGQGATSTTRTLTTAGVGGAVGTMIGGPIGGKIGAAGGAIASGPLGLKYGIKAKNLLPSVPRQLKPLPARAAPWLLMKHKQEQ